MMHSLQRTALVAAITLFLVACNSGSNAPDSQSSTSADVAAPTAPEAASAPVGLAVAPYVIAAGTTAGGSCALDAVDGVQGDSFTAIEGATALFSGWFVDNSLAVPSDARLLLQGPSSNYVVDLVAGGERPDVAAALASDAARLSGFNVSVSLATVSAGKYAVSILHGGAAPRICGVGKTLAVSPAG